MQFLLEAFSKRVPHSSDLVEHAIDSTHLRITYSLVIF